MQERYKEIDDMLDGLQKGIERTHETVVLEAMFTPEIADPEIHLTDEELDEFLLTFAETEEGEKIRKWIEGGIDCEANRFVDGNKVECENKAVGSVDFESVLSSDSVLSCREDMRFVYGNILSEAVRREGIFPGITINGKEVPKPLTSVENALSG